MNFKIFGLIVTMAVCLSAFGVIMSDSQDSDASSQTQNLTVGEEYTWYPGVQDVDTCPTWVEGDLPPGITDGLDVSRNEHYFAGTPTTSGTYTVSIYHIDDVTTDDEAYVYMTVTFIVSAGEVEETYTHVATLKYDANGGTNAPSTQTHTITSSSSTATGSHSFVISSSVPTRDGYSFSGWLTIKSSIAVGGMSGGTSVSVDYGSTVTLYAVWTVAHVINYDMNGGEGESFQQVVRNQSTTAIMTVSSVEPTMTGYKFLGWSYYSDSIEPMFVAGDTITVDVAITLFAIWTVDNGEDDDDDDDTEFLITSSYPTEVYKEGMAYVYELTFSIEDSYTISVTGISWLTISDNFVSGIVPEIVAGQTSINYVLLVSSSNNEVVTQTVIITVQAEETVDQEDIETIAIIGCLIVILLIVGYIAVKRRR